jgi:hypothetical protein
MESTCFWGIGVVRFQNIEEQGVKKSSSKTESGLATALLSLRERREERNLS